MKILYGARMGRWDLQKAVTSLATHLAKWTKTCVRALFRLMCYINSTTSTTLTGHIGDPPKDLTHRLYADADFAGDKDSFRSTPGAFMALVGPRTLMPPAAKTKHRAASPTPRPRQILSL